MTKIGRYLNALCGLKEDHPNRARALIAAYNCEKKESDKKISKFEDLAVEMQEDQKYNLVIRCAEDVLPEKILEVFLFSSKCE